ncbi:MAG: U32 family peptidase [Firmicutes bacterium]|nr:U32 family peptidase [Bacillota bacterium]
MKMIPELLAPVGGWEQLEAAVYNGADAVYVGGSVFNARMKADNFGGEKMQAAIDLAHEWGVKVYVTLNTLIRERELAKAFAYANDLYGMGADGLIIQDIGLARLIHRHLPDMPLHLSTQGTVYNEWAADLAKDLGFCRIVPARELTLEEIRRMAEACHGRDMDVEVFVHGALCMCYSGQCQMSRLLGAAGDVTSGRSGNRGLCAQPCRLQYADDRGRKSYALSPKDLCLIEDIPALCEAGVDSLKIEGRLKSPEYVAVVTQIYRKYLDRYAAMDGATDYSVDPEDLRALRQIFNRGDFTKGYLYGNPGNDLLSGTSPKNQGLFAGRVKAIRNVKTRRNKDAKAKGGQEADRKLIDVDVRGAECDPIVLGDGVELPETGNVITYVEKRPGGNVRIGDLKGQVRIGDEVRKVTDAAQLKDTSESYKQGGGEKARRSALNMKWIAAEGKEPRLEIRSSRGETLTVIGDAPLERVQNVPSSPERIRMQLQKLGGTPFAAGKVDVRLYGDPMVPISVVNRMRREAVEGLLAARRKADRTKLTEEELLNIGDEEGLRTDNIESTAAETESISGAWAAVTDAVEEFCINDGKGAASPNTVSRLVPLEWFMEDGFDREGALPYVLNVSKGNLDTYIEEHFDEIAAAVQESGILLGNLGWIRRFQESGVKVYGDYGLNVFNSQAAKAFAENEVEVIALSDEWSADGKHVARAADGEAGFKREPALMQRVPLMITEHPFATDRLIDRKGVKHDVLKWYSSDKYLIF